MARMFNKRRGDVPEEGTGRSRIYDMSVYVYNLLGIKSDDPIEIAITRNAYGIFSSREELNKAIDENGYNRTEVIIRKPSKNYLCFEDCYRIYAKYFGKYDYEMLSVERLNELVKLPKMNTKLFTRIGDKNV